MYEVDECVCGLYESVRVVVGLLVHGGEECMSMVEPFEEFAKLCRVLEIRVEEECGWGDSGVALVVEVVEGIGGSPSAKSVSFDVW